MTESDYGNGHRWEQSNAKIESLQRYTDNCEREMAMLRSEIAALRVCDPLRTVDKCAPSVHKEILIDVLDHSSSEKAGLRAEIKKLQTELSLLIQYYAKRCQTKDSYIESLEALGNAMHDAPGNGVDVVISQAVDYGATEHKDLTVAKKAWRTLVRPKNP